MLTVGLRGERIAPVLHVVPVASNAEILASVGDVTKRAKMLDHGRIIKQLEEELKELRKSLDSIKKPVSEAATR